MAHHTLQLPTCLCKQVRIDHLRVEQSRDVHHNGVNITNITNITTTTGTITTTTTTTTTIGTIGTATWASIGTTITTTMGTIGTTTTTMGTIGTAYTTTGAGNTIGTGISTTGANARTRSFHAMWLVGWFGWMVFLVLVGWFWFGWLVAQYKLEFGLIHVATRCCEPSRRSMRWLQTQGSLRHTQ